MLVSDIQQRFDVYIAFESQKFLKICGPTLNRNLNINRDYCLKI